MGWKGARRKAESAALATVVALVLAAGTPVGAQPRTGTVPPFGVVTAAQEASPTPAPLPPRLPRDFRGKGKWIVRDLDITVPFTWEGRGGDSQMTAGGPQYPIWFTNLIYHDTLYTLTYKWPGLDEHPCSRIPGFNLEALNKGFEDARFVGRETLRRTPDRHVNHWRVGVVFPDLPPGNHPRLPLALGDIYVDENNRGTFWQVLQFGVQNLYDPELDEWLVMDTFEHRPGTVTLPRRCEPPR
ncbi:hypothetical protein DEJ51_33295 [Streptomyces venezuelae]|uniref:Secreted protein n=1 Tax=Streptomyces venezuelae TaxID=54571 RepID=A0A5P2E0J3_STRVZ|nr:hypothetical protein [Streptomyces venezuelae]QES58409.1 hypothetical protein DEJ51_33295 [Streptomyces venezuelae]